MGMGPQQPSSVSASGVHSCVLEHLPRNTFQKVMERGSTPFRGSRSNRMWVGDDPRYQIKYSPSTRRLADVAVDVAVVAGGNRYSDWPARCSRLPNCEPDVDRESLASHVTAHVESLSPE